MDIIIDDIILDNANTNINNMLIHSNYFERKNNTIIKEIPFICIYIIQISFICIIYISNANILSRLLLFDSVIQSVIFYANYKNINFLIVEQSIIDRYIYYGILSLINIICNCITLYFCYDIFLILSLLLCCPTILHKICIKPYYKKYRDIIYNYLYKLTHLVLCKQLLKIINIINIHILHIDVIQYNDIVPFYNKSSWIVINKFIISFFIACIFNYLDKGIMKLPLIICKNVYMKDMNYNITDDKQYVQQIVNDKQWNKLLDVYTLNRMIRLCFMNNNNSFTHQTSQNIIFRFNRLMFSYTILNVFSMRPAIISFLLFIKAPYISYIINTLLFVCISYFTKEQFLVLLFCEFFYLFLEMDIVKIFMDAYSYNN